MLILICGRVVLHGQDRPAQGRRGRRGESWSGVFPFCRFKCLCVKAAKWKCGRSFPRVKSVRLVGFSVGGCESEEWGEWKQRGEDAAYSNAYSTATEHASLDFAASSPCCRRLWRVGNEASQAGQECSLIEDSSESRDRLEERDIVSSSSWSPGNFLLSGAESKRAADMADEKFSLHASTRFIRTSPISGAGELCTSTMGSSNSSGGRSEEQYDEQISSSSSSSEVHSDES